MFSTIPYVSSRDDPELAEEEVYFYGLSFCEHCTRGRELLDELGIPYRMTYLDELAPDIRRPVLTEFRRIYGKSVLYPVLEIDGAYTFGYDRQIWSELLRPLSQET